MPRPASPRPSASTVAATLGSLLCLVARPALAETPRLTLPELIALARERSKAMAVAEAGVKIRQSQKREALYAWTPSGEITYIITGAPAIQCRGPNNDANPATRTENCVNTVDPSTGKSINAESTNIKGVGMQGTLTLLQPIYTFGKIEAAMRAAEQGVEAERAGVDVARGEVDVQCARAYWGLKAARTALATLDSVRGEIVPWVEKIQHGLDSPRPQYTVSDLQRLKTALDELDIVRADLQRGEDIARAGIHALTSTDADIDDQELNPVPVPAPVTTNPERYFIDAAQGNRPELRALQHGLTALRELAQVRRNEMLPDIGLVITLLARYTSSIEDADSAFLDHATTFRAGVFLGLRQPLDFFERYARFRHAQADADELSAKRSLVSTGIDFELRSTYADLQEARRRLATTDHGQSTARGWLTAVKQNLDLGTAEPRDLTDAARQYVELRLRYFQAIADVNVSLARLQRATGIDLSH